MPGHLTDNRVGPAVSAANTRGDSESRPDSHGVGCCGYLLVGLAVLLVILTLPFSLFLVIKIVREYERAVIFRLGRILSGGARGPGVFFVLPCVDRLCLVDRRTVLFDVPPQSILSKDSVTVIVDAVVYFNIIDPVLSVTTVANVTASTRYLAQTTLRNVLGSRTLTEILAERDMISRAMLVILDEATAPWGVKVERVEITDVKLPRELQRAMAAEAEAIRESNAKVIAADGEKKASRSLQEAAEIMTEAPAALQLRYLQTLATISTEKNSTVIFPLPMEIMSFFAGGKNSHF